MPAVPPDSPGGAPPPHEQTVPHTPTQHSQPRRGRLRFLRWLVPLTLGALALAAGLGYLIGDRQQRTSRESEIQSIIAEQFALGLLDLEEERFQLARQRFEYIIQLDPSFPEAAERLAEALLGLREPVVAAPTAPVASPTPNLAPAQEILDSANAAFREGDWDAVIQLLLALRGKDPDFQAVAVDGLMYGALRNRGIRRISVDKQLEEGIYDLSLAQSFGPLDEEAENWRSWAQLYLTANSYFGLNWEQATFYFDVVYRVAPGIRNDVTWKYAFSAQMYALQLADAGDPCMAEEIMDISLEVLVNEELAPTATAVRDACRTATAPPPAPPPTDTPAATLEPTPSETATPDE